jgi:hypothetical protein
MDLNPVFTGPTSFRPATTGAELDLFAHAGIPLVHGWLVDPASAEHAAVARAGDYDTAANLIVEADVLTRGRLVQVRGEDDFVQGGSSSAVGPSSVGASSSAGPSGAGAGAFALTEGERRKVDDGVLPDVRSRASLKATYTSRPAADVP